MRYSLKYLIIVALVVPAAIAWLWWSFGTASTGPPSRAVMGELETRFEMIEQGMSESDVVSLLGLNPFTLYLDENTTFAIGGNGSNTKTYRLDDETKLVFTDLMGASASCGLISSARPSRETVRIDGPVDMSGAAETSEGRFIFRKRKQR